MLFFKLIYANLYITLLIINLNNFTEEIALISIKNYKIDFNELCFIIFPLNNVMK